MRKPALSSVVRPAAGFSALVGFAVLLGWLVGVPWLRSGFGGVVAVNPGSAFLSLLSAVSLWSVGDPDSASDWGRRLGVLLAGWVLLAAGLVVAAPLLGIPSGFELAAIRPQLDGLGSASPRPLSAGSGIVYLMVGAGLLLVRLRQETWRLVGRSLGLLIAILGLLSLVTATLRLLRTGSTGSTTGLGMVIGLIALALGLASAGSSSTPAHSQEPSAVRGRVSLVLTVAVLMLIVTSGLWFWSNSRSLNADTEEHAALQRRAQLSALVAGVQEAERYQVEHRLSGDAKSLERFRVAAGRVSRTVDSVTRDSLQARRLTVLRPLLDARLVDSVRAIVAGMQREEDSLAAGRTTQVRSATRIAVITNFLAGLLAICFLILAGRAISRDLKEKARIEAERDRFFTLSLDMLCIAKSDGYFKRINPAFTATLGWSLEELTSKPFLDFVHPDDRAATLREVERQAVAGEPVLRFENRYRHKDGSWRVLSWRSVPQPGGLMYATARDVTDAQLAQAALEAAKEAADVANRAKSDFLAKMSHELRTPLNSIIGFSEILEGETAGSLSEKQRRYVANVLTSGRNLLQLINDILDLSKVEAGRMELITARLDLADTLEQAREMVAPLADRKGLGLELGVAAALPPVLADQVRVKQILFNLLSNAIKFTPEGGQVGVVARWVRGGSSGSSDPGEVEVAVTDTGIGIAPEDLERIFREFEQVGSAARQNSQGTGLGLALTRKLVELHGGRISVESAPGRGSTFRFSLPCVERRTGPREPPPDAGPGARGPVPLVLVVDDDPKSRDLISHYLEESGYRAAWTPRGLDAVRLARELKPDAITLDLILPDRDGLVVLAQLKSDPETRRIPVVVVSITERSELGFSLGAEEWLVKPVQQEVFQRALDAATSSVTRSGTRTILVVDDDPAAVEYLTELVQQRGCEVLSASNGREGLALAIRHLPDAIILDLAMPQLNGFEVVKALRENRRTRATPILIVTAMDLTLAERRQLRAGVQGIVSKGWQAELVSELGRLCHPAGVPA